MQKIALAVILIVVFTTCITAQTVLFSEDFENTSSISLTSSGTPGWNINSRLQAGGNYSDSANCNTGGDSSVLTSSFFSTTGNTYILLEFGHICKIEFFDAGYIEVSNDSGQTWARATGSHYLGAGQFASIGNKFTSTSYNSWLPGNPSTPLNSWWKHELFDISALASNSQYVAIRFILKDENAQTVFDNHGWFLDNIIIQGALSELTPPNITLSPPVQQGIVFSLGPFPITAYITDTSGIDTAFIVYRVNNGSPDTVGMNLIGTDTFRGYLPPVNDLDSINYHIIAIDASASNNAAQHPAIGTLSFIASSGLYLPYYNNFEIQDTLWEPTTTDPLTQWEWGTPNYGLLTGAHSGVHAWTVNKDSAYSNNVDAILTSPFFNFSQATDMVLSFWQNRNTESTWDGAHLEITTDGVTWNYLGGLNDPNGINWYTDTVYASGGLPAWEGSSGGWIKSEYNLSLFNNQPMVRFRFVFKADPYVSYEGMSIDDFRISPGVNKDAGIVAVTNPVSGCNLNFQPVITAVKNYGIDTIFGNMMLAYQIGNNTPVIETFTDTLSPNDTGFFSFNTMADLSTASSTDSVFTIKVFSMLTGDTIYDNDTLSLQIISGTGPADPAVQHQNIPYATATVVTAISSDTLYWYNSSTAVGPIHIGSSYATPVLYDSTTYFVEARKGIGNVKFTEITLESTGAGSSNPYPAYIPPTTQWDGVEITNTGASAIDLTGYRFIMEGYKSINYTLPQGLVLWPGDVLVLTIYSFPLLTDDTLHNMFVAGNQSVYSTSQLGFWLEAPDGAIADAVATNGYSFGTGSQVTPSDWSGAIPSAVGKAGVIRVINDNNNASDWVLSDIPQPVQTIGAFNPALPYPTSLGCPGNRLPLNVTIFGKPDHDAGVIELLTPRTDSMLTNAEVVTMVVKNFGNLAIQNIPVGYQLDNNIPVVDTIAATIQPGDTLHFTFSSKADLSAFAIYQFTCFTNLATDTILINDTLTEQVIHTLPTYCPSSANYTSLIDIGHFSYGDINNPSPTGAKTYTDFTSLPIKGFKKGIPYPISITQQPQGTSIYTCAFEVYVDLNKDGIFDKTTESIFFGVTNSTAQTVSGFAAIPASASTGLTRMRVVLMYGSSIANVSPCGTYNYGETEDYNIEILPPSQYDATITGISGFT
ncbi:MAG: GEVED domain-containing protein, partial [Bacteroidales bacterium]|nr:GEVED domain-containing protein [Bacteroidales bacterium]